MENPAETPRPTAVPLFNSHHPVKDPIPSSSPAFGTPAYPIASRPIKIAQPFGRVAPQPAAPSSTVLPIILPPQTLRPVAFRTLTKKHSLTLTSSALQPLATFIGKHCGSRWREEGLAERLLDEFAKSWKRANGGVIVEDGPDKKFWTVLKAIEPCMIGGRVDVGRLSRTNSGLDSGYLSRPNSLPNLRPDIAAREDSQNSLGLSALDVEGRQGSDDESLSNQSARSSLKVVSAFNQPRLLYSATRKSLEPVTGTPSLLPSITHRTAMFRHRYELVHQRLMRNELFQAPAFPIGNQKHISTLQRTASGLAAPTIQQTYKITPIANLLGRSGTSHLLLGLLVTAPAGELALTDLTGSIILDISSLRAVQKDGAWYCPGMIVVVEGTYLEDGSNATSLGAGSGVGGMIGGRFTGQSIGGPPAERRDVTLDIIHNSNSHGAGFGWVDFLGVGSEKAIGSSMRRTERRLFGAPNNQPPDPQQRTKVAILGNCTLDSPSVLTALRGILSLYTSASSTADLPLALVFMGNFISVATMAGALAGGGSVEYKEVWDALASVLSEFPKLLASTTLIFVPGDNDPWASTFGGGMSTALPREGVPEIFTSRVRRAVATANTDAGRKDGDAEKGEVVWTSNPARMSVFGPLQEIVLFRDDITGRLRRSSVTFPAESEGETVEDEDGDVNMSELPHMNGESSVADDLIDTLEDAASHVPETSKPATNNTNTTSASPPDAHLASARRLTKSLLDQSHLSPFPTSLHPVLWDYASSSLSLYPLPTALVLCDAEAEPFSVVYEGCAVMNAGAVCHMNGQGNGGEWAPRARGNVKARWVEWDVKTRRGGVRDGRF